MLIYILNKTTGKYLHQTVRQIQMTWPKRVGQVQVIWPQTARQAQVMWPQTVRQVQVIWPQTGKNSQLGAYLYIYSSLLLLTWPSDAKWCFKKAAVLTPLRHERNKVVQDCVIPPRTQGGGACLGVYVMFLVQFVMKLHLWLPWEHGDMSEQCIPKGSEEHSLTCLSHLSDWSLI